MKLGEIIGRLMPLLEDAHEAEKLLDQSDTQFCRRAFVRSAFSMIEATLWVFKQMILELDAEKHGELKLTIGEQALLSDQSFELTGSGDVRSSTKYPKLSDNTRFTFALINRIFRVDVDLGVGTKKWDDYVLAQRIRNRITHPKATSDIVITDQELAVVRAASSNFNDVCIQVIDALHGKMKASHDDDA